MLATHLYQFPREILVSIACFLDLEGTCSFCPVSKLAREIIQVAATGKYIDFDFYKKDVDYKSDGLNSLLYLKIKIEKFTTNSMFFESLGEMTAQPAFEKPKDVLALWSFAADSYAQMLTLVVFDFTTKQLTGESLSIGLHATIPNEESDVEDSDFDKVELIKAILIHPHANEIAANALESALGTAIAENNSALIEKILNHPNAKDIDELNLLKLLESVVMSDDHEFLDRLQTHPIMQNVITKCMLRFERPRKRQRIDQ